MDKFSSPCISICRLDDEEVCVGCYRTSEEIRNWIYLDENQRQAVINSCTERADKNNT